MANQPSAPSRHPLRGRLLVWLCGLFLGVAITSYLTALQAGFLPVSLGGIVLRVETAALYVVSSIRYEFGR